MRYLNFKNSSFLRFYLITAGIFICMLSFSQNTIDTLHGRNLYHPRIVQSADSINPMDSALVKHIQDSILAREQFIRDSIAIRLKFIQDSIAHRQRMHDSLVFLQHQLPILLESAFRAISDQIVLKTSPVTIVGDSVLGDYYYILMPFSLEKPFTPWKPVIPLSGKSVKIRVDNNSKKITVIQIPTLVCSIIYASNCIIINEQPAALKNRWGSYYKMPVDSVFFNKDGKVFKIKKYIQFYKAVNYQKGAFLFTFQSEVKQFEYSAGNQLSKYQVVTFCERWNAYDPKKVCNIVDYTITNQGDIFTVTRQNNPANTYADGNFTMEYDDSYVLKSVAFANKSKSEEWKCFVELNEQGNVSRYVYQNKGVVNKTLLVNYYLDDPKAANKVETITCLFEDDGVSYYQQNNTTGKVRERDRLTMEWSPWK